MDDTEQLAGRRVAFMSRRLHIVQPATSRTLCGRQVDPLVYQTEGGAILRLPKCDRCWPPKR